MFYKYMTLNKEEFSYYSEVIECKVYFLTPTLGLTSDLQHHLNAYNRVDSTKGTNGSMLVKLSNGLSLLLKN